MTDAFDWLLAPPAWGERKVLLAAETPLGEWLHALRPWIDERRARLQVIAVHSEWPDLQLLCKAFPEDPGLSPLPVPTPGLHPISLDGGRVQLLLAVGTALHWLPQLAARVDAFLIGTGALEAEADAKRLCRALARLAAPQARLIAPSAWPRSALRGAGFEPQPDDTSVRARWQPRFTPRARPVPTPHRNHHALIIGAGLAGCAVAQALAEHGWRSTLIERHAALAQEASGNKAGLFHGVVHAADGAHARFYRAAALQARAAVRYAIDRHGALGATDGLLRLQTDGSSMRDMHALLDALRLPAAYVQALDAEQASARCGLRLVHPAWFYPGGGWVQPLALVGSLLARAGGTTRFVSAREVRRLQRHDGHWQLLDAAGAVIASAPVVALANAADALRLLGAEHWPVHVVRGQVSSAAIGAAAALPRVPLAGQGWLLPAVDGQMVFGATSQANDRDANVRGGDHVLNLARLRRLSPQAPQPDAGTLHGRVGWRCVAADRLPLIGPVPDETAAGDALRLRDVPRREGLFLLAALGSRGIAGSVLGARLIAAQMAGTALPLEAALVNAVDPARFLVRQARRRATQG